MIPPAWKDVWISPRAGAKLQATGVDKAGRRQYLYHPDFRARQEQAKFDKLVRFAEALPDLRQAMGEHMTHDPYDRERVCAVAVRLINIGWFRVGSDRYTKTSRTHGVTTLTRIATSPSAAPGSPSASGRSTSCRCGRRSSTPSSRTPIKGCSTQEAGPLFRYGRTASPATSPAPS